MLLLHDADADVVHVHHCIRLKGQTPLQHAVPMKAIGADVVVAYPADGDNREMGTGDPLANLYREQDLRMLPKHATFPDGKDIDRTRHHGDVAAHDDRSLQGR